MPHNGGRSQIQSNFILGGNGGDWPFLNLMKQSANWVLADNTGLPVPDSLDGNGYPISVSHSGVTTTLKIPSQAQRPGRYVMTWSGVGTTTIIVSSFTIDSQSGSKTTSSSTGRYEFLPAAGVSSIVVGIATAGVSNLKLFHVDDEALINAGNLFGQKFLDIMRQANCGVIRFLNWQNGNGSSVTTWATRKPTDYVYWNGEEFRASIYATPASSPMTNSGADYSITFGSGSPSSNRTLLINFNANWTPVQATVTYTAGTPGTVNAVAHPFVNDDPIAISTTGAEPTLIFRGVTYYVVNAAADTFQLAYTSGGPAIQIGTGAAGTQTVTRCPTINLNGTGAVPIKNSNGETLASASQVSSVIFTTQTTYGVIDYDEGMNSWLLFGGSSSSRQGLANGVPIEVCFQLAEELGAHPYFVSPKLSLDPMTDWHTELATYCEENQPNWMIPRFEALNEPWNSAGFGVSRYAWVKSFIHWGPPAGGANNQFQYKDWVGKVASTMGQAINAVYGGDIDGSRYWAIAGIQTVTFVTFSLGATSDPVLTAASYVAQSAAAQSGYVKEAAYKWLTHVCGANYFTPGIYGKAAETTLATAYAGGDLSAAVTYALNCNATPDADYNLARLRLFWPNLYAWAHGYTNRSGYKLRMTAYEGGYSADINVGETAQVKALRTASKFVDDAKVLLIGGTLSEGTAINGSYNDFVDAGGEFPSCFQLSGANNIWSILDPDIYADSKPQFDAIVEFNNQDVTNESEVGGASYVSPEELAAIRRYWEELEEGRDLSRKKRSDLEDQLGRTIEAAYDKAMGIEPEAAKAIAAVIPKAALLPAPDLVKSRKIAAPAIDWNRVAKDIDAVDRILLVLGKQIDRLDDNAKLSAAARVKLDRLRQDEEDIELLMLAL